MHKLCRFIQPGGTAGIGLVQDATTLVDVTALTGSDLSVLLEKTNLGAFLSSLKTSELPKLALNSIKCLAPVNAQEVWAAGVTYLRSKKARMEESEFSASAYDRVYEAPRPEIFFKSVANKVSPHEGPVGIRADAKWNVPEPELALVINSRKELVGYTIGNDMSSRDIEGENLLYLPQAKCYKHACALGPFITVGVSEEIARTWTIGVEIQRAGKVVFGGETGVNQIKRTFGELIEYLFRSQEFPSGVVLLTGTGVVPGDDFTLAPGDSVAITISGVGTLRNTVETV